ncbi:MAG: tyrosine-protein phosphatase [Chloroflexi bacterium]|nr:tyrosine-protein phosphatase [Chloroflexota bacterium]
MSEFWPRTAAGMPVVVPESLVIEPAVAVRVARLADGRFQLWWRDEADQVEIFALTEPESREMKQLAAAVGGRQTAVTPVLPGLARPYFAVQFSGGPADGRRVVVAERFLPLRSGLNFRDIGGYRTGDGREVRWGQVYRSGSLAGLVDADLAYLDQLGLRMVCDLRSPREVKRAPDRLPAGWGGEWVARPLSSQVGGREQARLLRQQRHELDKLLRRMYTQDILEENARSIGDMFIRLGQAENRPALFHCAAGKDRTGVMVALLLAMLGVPDETIVADYTLSNLAHGAIEQVMRRELRQALWVGIRPSQLSSLLLANPETLRFTLTAVREKYGSVSSYLRQAAGVSEEVIDRLREGLLA